MGEKIMICDVVKYVGVFVVLVFYVLNGINKVFDEIKEWILIVVKELNYELNLIVVSFLK